MNTVRVMLADDHTFLCDMLAACLEEAGMVVVSKVHDTQAAVAAARCTRPDVAVLDIDMPGMSVFYALQQLFSEQYGLRVLLLSAHVTDHYVSRALQLEVAGYLQKTEPLDVIVDAVRKVASGGLCFSAEVRARIAVDRFGAAVDPRRSRIATLTPREIEVLGYVANGLAKKEIADLLDRSVKTVDQHCTNLMTKLEIHDRVQLTRFAIREGVVPP